MMALTVGSDRSAWRPPGRTTALWRCGRSDNDRRVSHLLNPWPVMVPRHGTAFAMAALVNIGIGTFSSVSHDGVSHP